MCDFGVKDEMFKLTKEGKELLDKFVDLVSLLKINFPVLGESPHTPVSQFLSWCVVMGEEVPSKDHGKLF